MATLVRSPNFNACFQTLDYLFRNTSQVVHTERWQGADIKGRPDMRTNELLNASISVPLRGVESLDFWRQEVRPNLPWADVHFEERVCGQPLNPPPSYKIWPWGDNAEKFIGDGQFNHSYPERLWPKYAGMTDKGELAGTAFDPTYDPSTCTLHEDGSITRYCSIRDDLRTYTPHRGIRWRYGDLNDLVQLLINEPHTRQAWIPLFFPEDTGVGDGGRKPCTLGYQFIVRDGKMNMYYPLRSCDYVRHFKDDIYLAIRLLLWVLKECRDRTEGGEGLSWDCVKPGEYTMHATSLHVFANDMIKLRGENEQAQS